MFFLQMRAADLGQLEEVSEDDYEGLFSLNVKSVIFTVQKALPRLTSGSSIVLNGSMLTVKAFRPWGSPQLARLRSDPWLGHGQLN